jgi:MFS family permease
LSAPLQTIPTPKEAPWYAEVTRYQWLVLVIASAGWVFDAFEGQLYNITRDDLLHELLKGAPEPVTKFWGDVLLVVFLLGGTVGGIGFGKIADRVGRKPAMAWTIIFYAIFSGFTFFATRMWEVAALRFLVAMGVGGEWAVAASLVAEVFPARARARAAGIFHATSVAGTWIAALAGLWVGANWRYAYLVGVIPALLVFWVMVSIKEPKTWTKAVADHRPMGSFRELFGSPRWGRHAIFGMLLASVGLATFWAVLVAGQDLTRELLLRHHVNPAVAATKAKFAFGFVQATGLGLGLVSFGPLAEWLGRRGAFLLMHLVAVAIVPATCYLPQTYWQLLLMLPLFGFFVGGMHAGYAVYFPELFPSHLRATGAGFCFNGGRFFAGALLWVSAMLKSLPGVDLRLAMTIFSSLFLVGALLLLFLPETKGKPLPQ